MIKCCYFINVVYTQLDDLCYYTTVWELKQGNLHKPVYTSNKSRNIGHHANAQVTFRVKLVSDQFL